MRRLQHSLAVTVVVTSLLAAQLRVGTYGRPSLLDATTTTTATAATATTTRSSDSSGGRVEAAAVASTIYSFLVHVALVLSSLALTVLQCYRRAMERRGGAAGGPPGSRWNGSRWIVDEVLMPTGGFGGAGLAPATAAGGGPSGVRHPPSAYPPGPSAYRVGGASGGGVDDFGMGAGTGTGTGGHQGYQGTESPEEARLRFERERMEAEYWARVERDDEEREAREEREERERERKAAAKSAKKQAKRQGEGKRRGRKEDEPRARVSFSLNHLVFTRACIFLFTLFSPKDTAHRDRATGEYKFHTPLPHGKSAMLRRSGSGSSGPRRMGKTKRHRREVGAAAAAARKNGNDSKRAGPSSKTPATGPRPGAR